MKNVANFLKYIFDVKDIFWYVLGFATPAILNYIERKVKRHRKQKNIIRASKKFENTNIVSLAHGDPYFIMDGERRDISLAAPQGNFHIAMPQDIHQKILEIHPKFDNTNWKSSEEFLDGDDYEKFCSRSASCLDIPCDQFQNLYREKKQEVAEMLLNKLRDGGAFFNGEMYGIYNIVTNRETAQEFSTVDIRSYKSDYYTHRVMAAIYRSVYSKNREIAPTGLNEKYLSMRYYLTSLGMNVLIILTEEFKNGGVVFVKRSRKLFNMVEAKWHVTMNEAVSITDILEGSNRILLDKCIRRGINEELGINVSLPSFKLNVYYSDIFLLRDPLETGISAYVMIDGLSFDELKIAYSAAKDRELESENITMVPYDKKDLNSFIENNDVTDACKYLVEMLIARDIKGEGFNK